MVTAKPLTGARYQTETHASRPNQRGHIGVSEWSIGAAEAFAHRAEGIAGAGFFAEYVQ